MTVYNATERDEHKPYTIRLLVKIANQDYIIGTLSINTNTNQLYYLTEQPDDMADLLTYLNTGQKTTPIRKVSFHTDQTHIKVTAFSENKPRDLMLDVTEIDFLPKDNSIKLLMVESFYIESGNSLLPTPTNLKIYRKPFEPNQERYLAHFSAAKNFSLIILLVPASFDSECLFYLPITIDGTTLLLADLKEDGHLVGRIQAYEQYDLIVFTTPYAPMPMYKSQKVPVGSIRAINHKRPIQSLIRIYNDNFRNDISYIKTILEL